MSIKQNLKRRMMMVVALAMTVAVLAAGTAHAATPSKQYPITMSNTASAPSVAVGEPVTFHLTVTNDEPNAISPVQVTDYLEPGAQFVSASSSQGQCTFVEGGENGLVKCDLGSLPPGGTAEIDVVVVPQEQGLLNNTAWANMLWNGNTLLANLTPIIPASVYVYPA